MQRQWHATAEQLLLDLIHDRGGFRVDRGHRHFGMVLDGSGLGGRHRPFLSRPWSWMRADARYSTLLAKLQFALQFSAIFGLMFFNVRIPVDRVAWHCDDRNERDIRTLVRTRISPAAAASENRQVVDAGLLVNWIRIVKSPAELDIMRQSGRNADAIIQRAVDTIEPGVRECDVGSCRLSPDNGHARVRGSYDSSCLFFGVGKRALEPLSASSDEPLPASTMVYPEVSRSSPSLLSQPRSRDRGRQAYS